jgi:hypothetical protein
MASRLVGGSEIDLITKDWLIWLMRCEAKAFIFEAWLTASTPKRRRAGFSFT